MSKPTEAASAAAIAVAHAAHNPRSAATELRLLEAAGEVFAEKGYRAATIRDIIKRAKANIAAVNYHFGDKEKLYAATFRHARKACTAAFPMFDPAQAGASPRERLHTYVRSLFLRMLDTGRPAWQWKLMAREMIEPTPVLDEMVEETIRPEFENLRKLIAEITGYGVDELRTRRCAWSVVGQAMAYKHAQAVVRRLSPEQKFDREDLEALADHVTAFSYAALECLRREGAAKA